MMKNLRYSFLATFLKKSKKLKKIRRYIKSKRIAEHPHVFKNTFKVELKYLGIMPAPILSTSIFFLNRWNNFIKKLYFRSKYIYSSSSNIEYDCSVGGFKKL
jgi:hypothetical protein